MKIFALVLGLATLGAVSLGGAGLAQAGEIEIKAAWSRATAPGQMVGVAYFEVVNHGEADVLRAAQVEGAGQAMLHRSANENGVMTMRDRDEGLPIGAHAMVTLQPGGDHLMLMGLTRPLRAGDRLKATLDFAHAGPIQIEIPVEAIGATGPTKP